MNTPKQDIAASTLREKGAHTPGPWARVDTADYAEIHPKSGKLPSAIALVGKVGDANLIAAAPELLAALRRLTTEAKLDGMESRAGWDAWINMADAALAKAEVRS